MNEIEKANISVTEAYERLFDNDLYFPSPVSDEE